MGFPFHENPADLEHMRLEKITDTLVSPWPMREENKLRMVWKEEYPSNEEKTKALVKAVEDSGIEPYEEPEMFPKIEREEIRLICWLAIAAEE